MMIDLSNYSCDKCAREFSRHCKHCYHTADKVPTRFKKKKKTGIQTPELRKSTPPPPPTSGSNAVKPNPNYVPPASVAKPKPTVCSMKLDDLRDWVKTRAQIGDVAYCHDRITEHHYIYCYRKPDDNPIWIMMQPEILEEYFKTESKGEDTMIGTINCTYETPCGWCTKWDKKCDKKIGCGDENPQRGLRAQCNFMEDTIDFSYGKCLGCKYEAGCDKECNPENNFKYFQPKENTK